MSGLINHKLFIKENKTVRFSQETLDRIREIILHYPEGRKKSAILPILHIAQQELGGYLSVDVMDYVATLLEIQPIEVYEVATFYSMFHLEPVGKYMIEVCRTSPCVLSGGEHILEYLEEILGIKPGETTPDGLFTLKTTECLGACDKAPVMQVNTEFYESMTHEKIDRVIGDLKKEGNLHSNQTRWAELF